MRFDGEVVVGKVFDPDAQPPGELSDLTGRRVPIGASGLFFVNFEFVWSAVKIDLVGISFPRGREGFRGGFVVSDRIDLVSTPDEKPTEAEGDRTSAIAGGQVPPESGDTGTGNGTQT
jgi:hypothetical protein